MILDTPHIYVDQKEKLKIGDHVVDEPFSGNDQCYACKTCSSRCTKPPFRNIAAAYKKKKMWLKSCEIEHDMI